MKAPLPLREEEEEEEAILFSHFPFPLPSPPIIQQLPGRVRIGTRAVAWCTVRQTQQKSFFFLSFSVSLPGTGREMASQRRELAGVARARARVRKQVGGLGRKSKRWLWVEGKWAGGGGRFERGEKRTSVWIDTFILRKRLGGD